MTFSRPAPASETIRFDGTNVTAVLGPTNTGKTFLAIERMVAHSSGVIGLPLRLLAREVYGKVVDRVGVSQVALITGEEKIQPPKARFHVCTVEAMPRRTDAAFVAIDEVQLAADLERGHVFTDRILHTRGRQETLLLGASTMRGVLERLLKGAHFVTRPRMSQLLYAGARKTTRLPRRSAIVAFSADEVYAIAELIRRQRGGAAVVMGALSPRTRNAQVELYQSGDVDFLVATDAIGMGLNLDVDHVAFAQDWKFDGFQYRQLTPAELGQIAGRAGRHLRDGTFGVTGRVDPLPQELVEALEGHAFPPVRVLQWRSDRFDFSSVAALKGSLDALPPVPELSRALPAVDQKALEFLSRDPGVLDRATNAARVELLWEACKLPDYRRIAPAQHAEIIATVYQDLVANGHVSEDYMAAQVHRADRTEGDIDTLSRRIAEIRTWTYISHRPGWLADPSHWQEKTRGIEDRLSDALHERLTKRFVDRRTSVLMKRLRENAVMEAEIGADGTVLVEGHHVGEMQGFRFTPDTAADGPDAKAVRAAAQKALAGEFEARAERFANSPNGDIALGSDGLLRWLGAPVAALGAGEDFLQPRIVMLADEQLAGPAREKIAARAARYVTYQVSTVLKPLVELKGAEGLEGTARGIAFRLCENFGLIQRRDVAEEIRSLDQDARAALRRHGVRFGAYHIFVPALVKPAPANLLTLLWAIAHDGREKPGFGDVTLLLSTGRTSAVADKGFDPRFYALAGYRLLGRRAVRVDILERLADLIRPALAWKPGGGKRPDGGYNGAQFLVTPAMMSILGATADDMDEILRGLGYRAQGIDAREVEDTIARYEAEAAAAAAAKPAAEAALAAAGTPGGTADGTPEAPDAARAPEATDAPALAANGAMLPETLPERDAVPTGAEAGTTPEEETAALAPALESGGEELPAGMDGPSPVAQADEPFAAAGMDEPSSGSGVDRLLPVAGVDDPLVVAGADEPSAVAESEDVADEAALSPGDDVPGSRDREPAAEAVAQDTGPDAPEAGETTRPIGEAIAAGSQGEPQPAASPASETAASAAPVEPVATAEPKLVQVWRPQRGEGRGGAREERPGQRRGARAGAGRERHAGAATPAFSQPPVVAAAAVTPVSEAARGERPERPDREGMRSGPRPPRFGKGGEDGGGRGPRFGAKPGEGKSGGRPDRSGDKPAFRSEADARRSGAAAGASADSGSRDAGSRDAGSRRTEKPSRVDPDSPFAKLAALRDKLGK